MNQSSTGFRRNRGSKRRNKKSSIKVFTQWLNHSYTNSTGKNYDVYGGKKRKTSKKFKKTKTSKIFRKSKKI